MLVLYALLAPSFVSALDPNRAITQYVFDLWDQDKGLPNTAVIGITQTRDGYLWLATFGGPVRFDGVRFKTFDSTVSKEIETAQYYSILESRDGTLWFGTYSKGLLSYKDGKFRKYGNKDGLSDERIFWIYEDQSGNLWLGNQTGLLRMRENKFTRFGKKEGLPGNGVWAIYEDRAGTLWVGTVGGGVYQFHNGTFLKFSAIDEKGIYVFLEDSRGNFWIGTNSGLYRIQNGKIRKYTTPDLAAESVPTLFEDRRGNLWIGTYQGLTRFHNEKFESLTSKNGLPGTEVISLYEDREQNLWVGTDQGLVRFHDGKFITLAKEEGLAADSVRSVYGNKNGDIWLGHAAGVSRLRNGTIENFLLDEKTAQWGVSSVFEDSKGTLWAGTGGAGLHILKNGKLIPFSTTDKLLGLRIWALYEDHPGSLWVTNFGYGVNHLENGRLDATFTEKEGLSNIMMRSFHKDKDDALLLLTEGGVNRFKNGRFSVYIPQSLLGDLVWTVYRDSDDVLWMGSNGGGLKRYQNGKVVSIRKIHGLFQDTVADILEDSHGNFWMSSDKGIFNVSKKELNDFARGKISTVHSVSFGKPDGMKNHACMYGFQPSAWKSADGKLWFPTVKGVVVIDPDNLTSNRVPPPVAIEKFVVDDKTVESFDDSVIDPGKRNLEFHYTALSFRVPDRVRFRYKLEGYDADWLDADKRRIAYYTNLPPRSYRFRVIASNDDGVWNEAGASFAFRLKPHFYQTGWFYLLCALAAISAAIALHRLRLKQIQSRFHAILSERSRLARELHDTLAQGMVGIISQLDAAEEVYPTSYDQTLNHAIRARDLARQNLNEARMAIRGMRPQYLQTGNFVSALGRMATELTVNTPTELDIQIDGEERPLPALVEDNLLRIAQESIVNCVKYARATSLCIEMRFRLQRFDLRLLDNGIGFDVAKASAMDGHFGLLGMKERVKQIGGELEIRSAAGKGTEILVSVPAP